MPSAGRPAAGDYQATSGQAVTTHVLIARSAMTIAMGSAPALIDARTMRNFSFARRSYGLQRDSTSGRSLFLASRALLPQNALVAEPQTARATLNQTQSHAGAGAGAMPS